MSIRTYTHFWGTRPCNLETRAWSHFYFDAQILIKNQIRFLVPGSLQGAVSGPDKRLIFDLARCGEYGHFELYPRHQAFAFCRTDQHDADVLITGLLLTAKNHMKGWITLTSDGAWEDWEEGRQLCRSVLNYSDENFIPAKSDFDSLIERVIVPPMIREEARK